MTNDQARTAGRLIEAAESGRLQTPGQWRDWMRRVKRQPARLQSWIWQKLQISLGDTAIDYLKRWWRGEDGRS